MTADASPPDPAAPDLATPDAAISNPATPDRADTPSGGSEGDGPICPDCGTVGIPGDRYCEACGAELPVTEPEVTTVSSRDDPCEECGGTFVDGWCDTCGAKQPDPRDHLEVDLGVAAGCTDRGLRHHRNEDAMALATLPDGTVAAVVSDGVSATVNPHLASQAAVEAALETLVIGKDLPSAHQAAQAAAAATGFTPRPDRDPPSCTFLGAVVRPDGAISLASLGDCRAYWLGQDGSATQLTSDDSWAQEQIEAGRLTRVEAHNHVNAHVITRWLGQDADPAWAPDLVEHVPDDPGRLVLCTDGLWNHLDSPARLAGLVDLARPAARTAVDLARFANDSGGHDNVTVIVVDVPPRTASDLDTEEEQP